MTSGKHTERLFPVIGLSLLMMMIVYFVSGCSIKLKDDDVYEASGNYIYDYISGSNYLILDVDDSNFPEDCKLDEEIIQFKGVSAGSEEMTLPATSDSDFFGEKTTWERKGDSSSSDIEGTWKLTVDDDKDITLELTLDSDGTFTLEAKNLSCDDFLATTVDTDNSSNDQGFINVGGTWKFTFKNSDDLAEEIIDYVLATASDDTFTLTRSDADPEDTWYRWVGTRSVNTFSHYTIDTFEYYTDEESGEDEFSPGTYTSKMTYTLTREDEFEDGTLKETWDFDDTEKSTVTKNYTFTGQKSE
ncbi:MAG: hypothetical protein KJ737_16300 [Proteobacteria bacterium]|nr:hypothetical protein [Pseudomonadota bacterium]